MSDPNFCFITGVGFSCAYSDKTSPMEGFLQRAANDAFYRPNSDHQELGQICQRYFGSAMASNIEELASFLALDSGADPAKNREQRGVAYDQLLKVITDALGNLYASPRGGDTKGVFRTFADFIVKQEIPVITFNYDLIFDQLLRNTDRWFPIDGYGVRIPLIWPDAQAAALERDEKAKRGMAPEAKFSHNAYLKLHGSLNWGVRYIPHAAAMRTVELGGNGAFPRFGGPHVTPIESSTYSQSLGHSAIVQHYWRPFIVPPVIAKQAQREGETFLRELWYSARWTLICATEIHVLGYSLPPSDFEVNALLREGFYGAQTNGGPQKRIIVVNKDPEVFKRMKRLESSTIKIEASPHNDVVDHLREFVKLHP